MNKISLKQKVVLTTGFIPEDKGRKLMRRLASQNYSPPLGLGYIASILEEKGYEVKIYDFLSSYYSVDEMVDRILYDNPDIIGISVITPFYEAVKKMAHFIKKKADIPIVFGGPHCSSFPVRTMKECDDIDFLIYGEGEFVFPQLIEALSGRLSYTSIPQLCYRDLNKHVILNKNEQVIENLDILPFPSWHLFNRDLYYKYTVSCIASRGCSYGKCIFCMRTGCLYEQYRKRSVNNVIAELEFLRKYLQYDTVMFFDDNFTQDEKWVLQFCDTLIQKKMVFQWRCNARVDTVTKKMIEKMAKAGCCMIFYGIESGSQESLDYLRKGTTIDQARKAIKFTKEYGIKVFGSFMLALPKETPEIGKKTVQFAIDLDLDFAQFVPARPLFGTKLYELCKKEGTIIGNPHEFYSTSFFSPRLMPKVKFIPYGYRDEKAVSKMIRFAYIRFYCRFRYFLRYIKHLRDSVTFIEGFLLFISVIFSRPKRN